MYLFICRTVTLHTFYYSPPLLRLIQSLASIFALLATKAALLATAMECEKDDDDEDNRLCVSCGENIFSWTLAKDSISTHFS